MREAGIEEKSKYMDVPYIKDDILYNICDCGSCHSLTKQIIESGYRCPKCGQKWIAKDYAGRKNHQDALEV